MMQSFEIEGRLVGLNDYTQACRTHRQSGARLKRDQQAIVSQAIKKAYLSKCRNAVYIHFTWIEPNMRRDKDNIAFAKKFILDALVDCEILKGDGWAHIEGFSDHFLVNKDNPRIIVEIEEI